MQLTPRKSSAQRRERRAEKPRKSRSGYELCRLLARDRNTNLNATELGIEIGKAKRKLAMKGMLTNQFRDPQQFSSGALVGLLVVSWHGFRMAWGRGLQTWLQTANKVRLGGGSVAPLNHRKGLQAENLPSQVATAGRADERSCTDKRRRSRSEDKTPRKSQFFTSFSTTPVQDCRSSAPSVLAFVQSVITAGPFVKRSFMYKCISRRCSLIRSLGACLPG